MPDYQWYYYHFPTFLQLLSGCGLLDAGVSLQEKIVMMFTRNFIATVLILSSTIGTSAQTLTGKTAPDLHVSRAIVNGRQQPFRKPAGKYLLLEFWATWCTPCVKNIPHLNDLASMYKTKVAVLSLTDETPGKIEEFVRVHPIKGQVCIDDSGKTFAAYGVGGRPRTVVVNPAGLVVYDGEPWALTREKMEWLLAGGVEMIAPARQTGKLGGWSGGQDPVVTGNFDMDTMGYARYEVVRKSVLPHGGQAWKATLKGEVGITLLGMTAAEILAFADEAPSAWRVADRSGMDTTATWDVIYYRKTGSDLGKGRLAVKEMVLETLGLRVTSEPATRKVLTPVYDPKVLVDANKVADDDPKLKFYELLSDICREIEHKTGRLVEYPAGAEELYADVFELGNKYYKMTGAEMMKWLGDKYNITFIEAQKELNFNVLYKK